MRNRTAAIVTVCALLLLLSFFFSDYWLAVLGSALVVDEPPARSDAVLVLAGDSTGNRIIKAAQLVQQGFAPVVLVSGPVKVYGRNEADLAIEFALAHGYPRELFIGVQIPATSTEEEGRGWRDELHRRSISSLLLVTSTYHTARARRTFRELMPEIKIHTVAARDVYFEASSWWKTREGQKTVFYEYSKTLAHAVGL